MFGFIERVLFYRRLMIVAIHITLVIIAYLLAFLLRFDFRLPADELDRFLKTLPLLLLVRVAVFAWFRLYEGLWQYISLLDMLAMLKAVTLSSLMFFAGILLLFGYGFSRSVFLLDWMLCLALVGGARLALPTFRELSRRYRPVKGRRTLIVGAGDAGEMLLREIGRNPAMNYEVLGFVDDDPRKQGRRIHGIEVVGTLEELSEICQTRAIEELLIAIPSATGEQRRRIVACCRKSGVPFKTVPALSQLLQGKMGIGQLQEVKPEDLLGRETVQLDLDRLRRELQGRRILVTGAGGSIGSELCRQLATFDPELLILFDRAESPLYFLELELKRYYPHLRVLPIIGDIRDRSKVEEVMQAYAPELLYHAAAYKHVPLMEAYPLEAIENNIFGTETVALAARHGGVKRFVFISTDKAVKPVGIMGMTKRVAEILLFSLNGGLTIFVAVRFGNVLESEGSVLPLFRWQIATGGPVTVTDPEASRYFMLASEAAQLVLQAGAMGQGCEIFFLDMGEPIRILDLAENLIRLSGLEPGRDVPVKLVGLRPGERLQENLIREQETLLASEHERVFIVQNHQFDLEGFRQDLDRLRRLAAARDRMGAVALLKEIVARY